MTTITLPTIPTTWTPASIITYVGALALVVIGALASFGVALPAGLSTEVAQWAGLASMVSGALVGLGAHVSHHGVVKAAIAAQPGTVTIAPIVVPPAAPPV